VDNVLVLLEEPELENLV